MSQDDRVERVAGMLADVLYSDTLIPRRESLPVLKEACRRETSLPSKEDAYLLIGYEEGDPEGETAGARYPVIAAVLDWLVAGVVPEGSPVSAETITRWAVEQ